MANIVLNTIRIAAILAIFLSAVATRKPLVIVLAVAVIWYYLDWVREDEVRELCLICPECGGELEIDEVDVGDIVYCTACDADFEVVSVKPPRLTRIEYDEEVWEGEELRD
jgi:alpha-aminoadipate carrier protein LysW